MTRAGYRMERRYNFRAMQRGKERGGGKKVAWNEGKINRPLIPKGTGYITYVYIYIFERNSRFKAASPNRGRIAGTFERKHIFTD